MAVALVTTYRIEPGGRDAFLAAARESVATSKRLGAVAALRSIAWGGAASVYVNYVEQFATSAERMAYVDQLRQPGGGLALTAAVDAANPAGTLVNRYLMNEIPVNETTPPAPARVISVLRWRVVGGHLDAARSAMMQTIQIRSEVSINSTVWTVVYGGDLTGELHLTARYNSFSDVAHAAERFENAHGGMPIQLAVAAGDLIPLGQSLSELLVS